MAKCCIYQIEDNPVDRSLLAWAIERFPRAVETHVGEDGETAIRIFEEVAAGMRCRPSIVILDLNLPKISGIEVLAAVRKMPELKHVPVVILTSSDSPYDRSATDSLGVERYLRKPMDLEEYQELLNVVLEIAHQRSPECRADR